MPPKVKISREEILEAAVQIVRAQGAGALNARQIAKDLNCSTQPVFSNFASMEELRLAVEQQAEKAFRECMAQEMASGEYPVYKASGMAYIRFAGQERELFKLLFMRDRTREEIPQETELGNQMEAMVHGNLGLDADEAKLFHLEMWAFVHGIAVMFATGYLELDRELVSRMLTDAYRGLTGTFEGK